MAFYFGLLPVMIGYENVAAIVIKKPFRASR